MKESLLNKVTTENLDKLHKALCDVIEEMTECGNKKVDVLLTDEDYVKCLMLAAKVLKAIANKSK